MGKMTDYLRVTEVLDFISGYKQIPKHILEEAGNRGEKVHELCTAIMSDIGLCDFEPRFDGYLQSFNKWCKGKKFIERPGRFYCDKYMITGEIDGIYEDKEGLVLIDLKTSAKENITWGLQGSAYYHLCQESKIRISRIEFIQLSKNGDEAKVYTYKEDFEEFLRILYIKRKYLLKSEPQDYLQWL